MTKPIRPAITPAAASGVAAGSLLPPAFLALGTFAIGTEGFMIAPLLPVMAAEFGMGLSSVAMLVVVFTLVLAVSSPIATVLTGRLRRRDTLLLAMALFTAGNLLAAVSPGFWTLMAARVLMAVAAGLYTPNANALAGAIVGPEKRGRALAIVSGGMTLAIALGLPLGALVGHAFGWRATFLAVAVMGVV
ncbi:MFS transporter, partial [Azospirillum brasilense]|nr:MFS transporter [Azospirillum brasilense]